ncbi:DUF6273 domain-containing protein [Succinimonas sp.]|uniref:DUF6273 domain-containing protein n=1 Tax=Succinimonas sp. TaxID=1936151 RepID=UPI003870D4E7
MTDAELDRNSFFNFVMARKGDTVLFGRYPQKADFGMSPIEWQVVSASSHHLLLVSSRVLDAHPFNNEKGPADWERSSLRAWLNTDFLRKAFSEKEQEYIAEAEVSFRSNEALSGTKSARDKVFCLSDDEVRRYLRFPVAQPWAGPTDYARTVKFVFSKDDRCEWWLRSRGSYDAGFAKHVDKDGSINEFGYPSIYPLAGVRPALRIDLEACRTACRVPAESIPGERWYPKGGISIAGQVFLTERKLFQYLFRWPEIGLRALVSGELAEAFKDSPREKDLCLNYASHLTGAPLQDIRAYTDFLFRITSSFRKAFPDITDLGEMFLKEGLSLALADPETLEKSRGFMSVARRLLLGGCLYQYACGFSLTALDRALDDAAEFVPDCPFERIPLLVAYALTPDRALVFNGCKFTSPDHLFHDLMSTARQDFPALARRLYQGRKDLEFLIKAFPDAASVTAVNGILYCSAMFRLDDGTACSFSDLDSFREVVKRAKKEGYLRELINMRDLQAEEWRMFSEFRNEDFLGALHKLTGSIVSFGEFLFSGVPQLRSYLSELADRRFRNPLAFEIFVNFYREDLDRQVQKKPLLQSDVNDLYDHLERLAVVGVRVFTDPALFESVAEKMLAGLSAHPESTGFFVSQYRESLEKLSGNRYYGPKVLQLLNAEKEIVSIDEYFFKDAGALGDFIARLKQDLIYLTDFVRAHRKGITALLDHPKAAPLARELLSQEQLCGLKMTEPLDLIPGDIYTMGEFPFSPHGDPAPLEWLALRVTDDKNCETASALLISRYALDAREFHHEGSGASWEKSDLSYWLNGEFLNTAFSFAERERILAEPLFSDTLSLSEGQNNGDNSDNCETAGGNDYAPAFKVFCLSAEEAAEYFGTAEERCCSGTPFALKRGALPVSSEDPRVSYWLRTPGLDGGQVYADASGEIVIMGERADRQDFAVRPVIRIMFRRKSGKEPFQESPS